MKKNLSFSVIIILVLLSLFFVVRQQYEIYKVSRIRKNVSNTLPSLNCVSIDGRQINISSLKKIPKFKLFIIFNSDCDHCHNQIAELVANSDRLNKLFVIIISAEPISRLRQYGEKINIARFENFMILNQNFILLNQAFDCSITPTLYLYNVDNMLVRKYKGETPLNFILNDIN